MKGVILHGGSGTRLRPLTYTDVKQLLPVAGKPVSEYALESLMGIGIKEINIIVGEVGEQEVRKYYGDGSKWNVKISYTYQDKPLGIAHAIGLVQEFVGNDDFVVVLGDNYFQNGLTPLYENFRKLNSDALVALTEVENPSFYGIATVRDGNIIKMEEKPKNSQSHLAVTGAYFLRKNIFDIISDLKPSWRNELEITEAFQMMLDREMSVGYAVIDGWWKDTGTVEEFLDCNRMVLDKIDRKVDGISDASSISGRASVEKDVKITGESRILGPCYIGKNTIIENSYIGPYTSIGDNCHLKNVEIEDSVIMDGSSIELSNGSMISQSLIGADTVLKPLNTGGKRMKLLLGRDSRIEM